MGEGTGGGARAGGDVLKGLAAGLAGGLAAAAAMNWFQKTWAGAAGAEVRAHGAQSLQQGSPAHGVARELRESGGEEERDDAAERTASALAEGVFERKLSRSEKDAAGTAVHYAFGATTGAIYGVAAELLPAVTAGAGLPFGACVWAAADEGVVPLLGLSK